MHAAQAEAEELPEQPRPGHVHLSLETTPRMTGSDSSPSTQGSPPNRRSTAELDGSMPFQMVMGAAEAILSEVDLQDLDSLILWCRGAAALQPDATHTPLQRCEVRHPHWG